MLSIANTALLSIGKSTLLPPLPSATRVTRLHIDYQLTTPLFGIHAKTFFNRRKIVKAESLAYACHRAWEHTWMGARQDSRSAAMTRSPLHHGDIDM